MTLLTNKQSIAIETDTSDNNASVDPDGGDALLISNLSVTPMSSDTVTRDYVRPYYGASETLLANLKVEISFSVEFVASGTAGTRPGYSKALLACGLKEEVSENTSVTYSPRSSDFDSAVIFYNLDGVRHAARKCRGNVALNATVGEIPTLDFTFTGIYEDVVDEALPTPVFNDQPTPLIFKPGNTSGFSLLGHQAGLNSLTMDLGNEIAYREVIGGSTEKEVLLTQRAVNGSVTIDAVKMATKDFYAAAKAEGALGALSVLHGTTAGNKVQVISSRADIGDISIGDADGIATYEIPYTLIPSASGDDEVQLIYT